MFQRLLDLGYTHEEAAEKIEEMKDFQRRSQQEDAYMEETKMKAGTLVTVFGKFPGVIKADGKTKGPADHIRVEYKGINGMQVNAYVPRSEIKERAK